MRIGWVGLGRLGYVSALTLAKHGGHQVVGYDIQPPQMPTYEAGADELDPSMLNIAGTVAEVVAASDVVFCAVQTPHAPAYGGETPAPAERRDFEYGYLVTACRAICDAANQQAKPITLAVVSTVLPGTCSRLIRPMLGQYVTLVYQPSFIALSTTIADLLNPEFVLVGADTPDGIDTIRRVYETLHDRPVHGTTVETAELVKVAYNVIISTKVVIGNTLMEICHKTGADSDAIVDALSLATDRVISPAYLRGGMGDGGACHPRDLIAMSWLAERLDLSFDLLGQIAHAREAQTGWLADLTLGWADQTGLDICVLGTAYKPGVPLEHGSPALLLRHLLEQRLPAGRYVTTWDPFVDGDIPPGLFDDPHVYVIGCKHRQFADYRFQPGSVVIDPHGYIADRHPLLGGRHGVTVIRVGRKT